MDRKLLRYVGTARAFVAGLETAAGTLEGVSSVVAVTWRPGREPSVTYRVGVTDGSVTSVLAAGSDVPISALAAQFNRVAASPNPYPLSLLGPSLTTDEDGTWTVQAPFLEVRTGGLTTRFVAVEFSGRR